MKKIISVFLSICICLCLFTPVCFADNSVASDHTHNWVKQKIHSYSLEYNGIAFGIDVYKCSDCVLYLHKMLFLGYDVPIVRASPDTALGSEAAAMCAQALIAVFGKEWYATKFEAGGGSASPGGVGRNPAGYVGKGVPTYTSSGNLIMYVEPYALGCGSTASSSYLYESSRSYRVSFCGESNLDIYHLGSSGSGEQYPNDYRIGAIYKFTAPVTGIYYIGSEIGKYKIGSYSFFPRRAQSDSKWSTYTHSFTLSKKYQYSKSITAGSTYYFSFWEYEEYWEKKSFMYKYQLYPIPICVEPIETSITNQTNITINNNTWNGNIYVDNSNKLTYIYPQYTTINENNETVTNISNNPIIYNQETKQYYTYDQTTNNYYYISYNAPTPTPTPTPDPTPSPSPDVPPTPIVPETQNLIIPKMNANSFKDDHGTWIASGSSKYSDVFDFFYAFDRSTANFWETNVSPCHLQIEIPDPESYYIDGYIMRISKFNNRYSKDWTLQGSDDGETWDDLDKQTGQNLSDMEEHKYSLILRKAYKYYRLNMSNYASSMCSLSHFNLLGYDAKDVTFPTPDPGGSGGGSGTTPTPTPAPTPDGPGGSGGGSGGNPLKWLAELLKDIVEGIFKAIWKLITSIFGFLIWLVSLLVKVLPFIPAEGLAALSAAAIIITVIRIIKFILGR